MDKFIKGIGKALLAQTMRAVGTNNFIPSNNAFVRSAQAKSLSVIRNMNR